MKKLNGEAKKILFKDFIVREIAVLHAKTAVIFLLLATLAFWNVYLSSKVIQLRDEVDNLLIPTCENGDY